MKIKTFIIDAFTNEPFKGNPAGVCLLGKDIDAKIMQFIAAEINLSETAFLMPINGTEEKYSIRYFTPTVEVDFCGHATLASAKLILDKLGKEDVEFETYKNLKIVASKDGNYIKMLFPLYDTVDYEVNQKLNDAFGINNPLSTKYEKNLGMLLIEVDSKETLLNIKPDFKKAIESSSAIKEVVITTKSMDKGYDFYSRCFCPWLGIDEDPVTGASHSVLAKYWGNILNKKEMTAYQLSKRGGFMKLSIISETTLEVRSNAQIMFEGVMMF